MCENQYGCGFGNDVRCTPSIYTRPNKGIIVPKCGPIMEIIIEKAVDDAFEDAKGEFTDPTTEQLKEVLNDTLYACINECFEL